MRGRINLLKKIGIVTFSIMCISLFAAFIGSSGLAGGLDAEADEKMVQQISNKVIRLHVIANSDSPEDQALKLRVKDEIVETLNRELEGIDDIEVFRQFIKSNLKYMEDIARRVIEKEGKDYDVKAVYGKFPFPAKTYGYVTLPAGEYQALRIIIGGGNGANWWCVLFPPLCFVDITREDSREVSSIKMNQVFTEDEIKFIQNAKKAEDVPIEIRFKIKEMWEQAKDKITQTIKLALK